LKLEKVAPGEGGGRVSPAQVDGDLELLDPETLAEMFASIELEEPEKVAERVGHVAGKPAAIKAMRNQVERIEAQQKLGEAIAQWAGLQRHYGLNDRAIHKKFYINFDKTITQALAEPKSEMLRTIARLEGTEV
jgi:hypothetical protein